MKGRMRLLTNSTPIRDDSWRMASSFEREKITTVGLAAGIGEDLGDVVWRV